MIERMIYAVLIVVAVVIGACVSGCDVPTVQLDAADWREVPPYPGAPKGTRCFVWSVGWGDSSYGGPECVTPGGAQ